MTERRPVIRMAQTAGFCFGVQRAVDLVCGELERGERVCTLGPIIHNEQVVAELAARGVTVIDAPAQNTEGRRVVLRSHGVTRAVYEELAARG
ncbi:MAG: bifunctional 4-hydroxy-3-methylbut-2-enyl diphosphate reductase/30S ribosomal protein S1, partial [Oscillospiraceae bacterium]